MRLFGTGKRAKYNTAWAEFRTAGRRVADLPTALLTDADVLAVQEAARKCPVCPHFRSYFEGPEVAGDSVPIGDRDGRAPSARDIDVMWHQALMILKDVVHSVGSHCYGGLFDQEQDWRITLAIWTEYANSRLFVLPHLTLGVDQIEFGLSHVVLWRQGWMTEHGDDDFGWADLSSNYLTHLAEGGTYWEVAAALQAGERFWHKGWFGVGFDKSVGEPVAISERFKSVFHFAVGDQWFRPGTALGNDLRVAQQTILQLTRQWGVYGQHARAQPQRPPDGRMHDAVRQREE